MKQDGIRIGTHYEYPFGGMASRPEWLPDGPVAWRRDLAMIKDTGFDSIRIRIGFDSSLDEVAQLLDLCQELNLQVLFGFATFYVNDQFLAEFPDAKVVDRQGQAYPIDENDYRWQRACINHPEYRRRRDALVQECATRFGHHPAVFAWDIHNEPSVGPGDHACYCQHTQALYRRDLAARFQSIEALNQRWGTAFRDFDSVTAPTEVSTSPESFWRDWREFMARNLNEFLLSGIQIIKGILQEAQASFNFTSAFHSEWNGQDWWVAPQLDYLSHSNYPEGAPENAAETGSRIDLLKGLAPGKDVWVAEFQGGPFHRYVLYRGIHLEAEVNKIFSHACRALYFYRWDPLMCGPEPWINAMTEPDTYDTERRLAAKRVIAELRQYEGILASGQTVKPRVGIYLAREMVWAANARKAPLYQTVQGLYALLLDLGFAPSFISGAFPPASDLTLIAVPNLLELTGTDWKNLQAYAEGGGRVIAELPMTDLAESQKAAQRLGWECKSWVRPIYFIAGWSINDASGHFSGYAFHDRVLLKSFGGNPIATYRDNQEPALIETGSGGRILIPTFALGRSYFSSFHQGVRRLIEDWLSPVLEPDVRLDGVPDEYRALVEARVVESDQGNLLFVINRSGYAWEIEASARGYLPVKVSPPAYGAVRQLLTKAKA